MAPDFADSVEANNLAINSSQDCAWKLKQSDFNSNRCKPNQCNNSRWGMEINNSDGDLDETSPIGDYIIQITSSPLF
jgi:hypothetical protein